MNRFLVFFSLILIFSLFTIVPPVFATCKKDITDAEKASFPVEASFALSTDEFAKCKPEDTAARGVQPNVPYTIHCQEESEKNSFFSLKAALCGSSDERGPNNATCWTCGGDLRCTGFGQFALGQSDPLVAPPINERQPVNPGDTNTDQVWRVAGSSIPQGGFTYNGLHYDKPPGDIIVCTSDNRACGAGNDTQCTGRFEESTSPPDQEAPIEVPGETNFANVVVFKDFPKGFWDIIQAVPGAVNLVLSIADAKVHPKDNILKNPSPFLENMGNAMKNATSFPLKPLMLQEQTVDATSCQKYEITGRICVYDNKNGALLNTDINDQPVTRTPFVSEDCNPAAKNERRQGLTYLAAIAAKYTQPDQNYEKPLISIKVDEPLGCDIIDPTEPLNTKTINSLGQHEFPSFSLSFASVLAAPLAVLNGFQAVATVKIVERQTILDKYEANTVCAGPDCSPPGTLDRVKYPVDEGLVNSGGAFRSFQPYEHDFKGILHGGDEKQQFDTSFGGVQDSKTAYSFANREEIGGNYVYCMISPLMNNHLGLFNNGECDRDWKREQPPQPPPNVPNTSSWAISKTGQPQPFTPSGDFAQLIQQFSSETGVPQCVIQGVADIEGGDRYDELPVDQCLKTTNTCSAVGPMQFTVGPGHGIATEEVCATQCAAGYCPNAWARYGNNGNPCSYTDSLSAASRYLADYGHFDGSNLQDSVHDATTAYYGSDNNALARNVLGGCEYWEYVYRTCEPSYVCQANR